MKPFKPPTIVGRQPVPTLTVSDVASLPPTKKRRLGSENTYDRPAKLAGNKIQTQSKTQKPVTQYRAPLQETTASEANRSPTEYSTTEAYYSILWRRPTTKKNKTWDGDGMLVVSDGTATLQDASGRPLGKGVCKTNLSEGSTLSLAGRELEVSAVISKSEVIGGRRFINNKPNIVPSNARSVSENDYIKNAASTQARLEPGTQTGFKMPLLQNHVLPPSNSKVPTPRHDPHAAGALVMKRPLPMKGEQIVDVVVDPILTKHLREHQRAGVSFLYECVLGMKTHKGEGAILADEMGLGKTLQTISLIWTLLKQNPIVDKPPVIKKALIVCPVTLINNWRKEFRKWLGNDRIGVLVAGEDKTKTTDFTKGKRYNVMIIGYERLRSVKDDLQACDDIGIVIADEGHRLKTAKNKSADAIKSLSTERRVILSGTPIQNDLEEFWTMVDFVNPGLLNKYSVFKREFEVPILKSQQPGAKQKVLELGEARSQELAEITNQFILRRTAEILSKYLPPKTEYVLFCRPTKPQATVYRAIVSSPMFGAALGSSSLQLELINVLKKVCNSPNLLLSKGVKGEEATNRDFLDTIPTKLLNSPASSGKLQVLDSLLHQIRTTTDDKVVLISNYTSTMDVLQSLLASMQYPFLRLDGQTPTSKRQELVDRFNRSSVNNFFVFLLSAKAGGVGLNLIGASRLILYDLDWNPATDLQAMARIHRDGQKKSCYIYRLLTAGALDEKIFQRQVSKVGLSDSIVDGKSSASGFTREELRDLFTLDESRECQTHKLLGCACGGSGVPLPSPADDSDLERNDLAALSAVKASTEIEVVDLADEPASAWSSSFQSSGKVDIEAQEEELRNKSKVCKDSGGRVKMLSLMQYTHFDTATVQEVETLEADEDIALDPLEGIIEDSSLRKVLREPERRINFVLTKVSA